MHHLNGEYIILPKNEAHLLAHGAIKQGEFIYKQFGGVMNKNLSLLAHSVLSAIGQPDKKKDPAPTIEYEWVGTQTAANIIGCTPRTVIRYAENNKLIARKEGKTWLIRKDTIDALHT